jgi:adhesin transport system outer membrane protein
MPGLRRHFLKTLALSASVLVLALHGGVAAAQDSGMPAMPTPPVMVVDGAGAAPLTVVGTPETQTMRMTQNTAAPVTTKTGGLPGKITLAEAISFGVRTNPEYLRNANNRRATDEELHQARGLYLPSLDFQADFGPEYSDNNSTRNDGDGDDTETNFRRQAGLTLTQMLFDGYGTKYENKRQQARVLSASHRVREASELIGLAITESYLDVLRQRELLRISRQNVADHLAIMEQIADSANVGRSTQADMEQIKARLASARANEASVRESLRIAEASFVQNVGDMPQDLVMPLVPVDALSANVEDEVKLALHQSPTLDIFEADIQVAHNEFQASKSTFYPEVNLQLNAREGRDLNGVDGRDRSASGLVVMNWNLYRGGIDTANVREHISREAQAKEERAKAARQIENETRVTWARMVSAGERAREFATQAAANQETVRAYKDQFDLGRRTLLDVLDAQNELFVSKSNAVNAEFVEMFAVYRLLGLKGELLPTLGVAYPRESDPAKM